MLFQNLLQEWSEMGVGDPHDQRLRMIESTSKAQKEIPSIIKKLKKSFAPYGNRSLKLSKSKWEKIAIEFLRS